jgi:HEAT repeat protein
VGAWPAAPRASDASLLRLLAHIDDPGATTALRAASSAPDASLRLIAMRALAARRIPALSGPAGLARVDARASWSERLLAVEAVGRSADAAATEALVEAARRDPDGWVRRAAVRLLRERSGASVDAALREVRDHDPDRALRDEALAVLRDR